MKSLFYFKSLIMGLVSAFFISSCTIDDQEFALDNTNDLQLQITEKSSTRSMEEDTLSPMEYVILEDIRDWVESLPTKSIAMATLANSYRIIGL